MTIADENFITVGNVVTDDQSKDCSEKMREALVQKLVNTNTKDP